MIGRGGKDSIGGKRITFYIPLEIIAEIIGEADRQDRSMSWIVTQAWKLSRATVKTLPDGDGQLPRRGDR